MAKSTISHLNKSKKDPSLIASGSLKNSNIEIPYSWIVLLLCFTFLVYLPGLQNSFVNWDDFAYIVDNPRIKSLSWESIRQLFYYKTYVVGNYHPFTVLSYALEYKFAGLTPAVYHLDNIFLHLINTFLFFLFVKKLGRIPAVAFIAAALFALHPMRVESVVWAAERKDVLYTCFFLLSSLSYLKYCENKKTGLLVLSLVYFLFSILSKGQAVVLPFTLLLIDYFRKRPFNKQLFLEKLPYFALALTFGLIALAAQHTSLTAQRIGEHSVFERFLFASYGLVEYLFKFMLPVGLRCFYQYPSKITPLYFLCPIVLIGITFLIYRYRNPWLIFGSLYFILTVSIVLQLLPVGNAIIAERYTYIPYMGFFIIAGFYIHKHFISHTAWKVLIVIYLVIGLGSGTFLRAKDWKNSQTLWTDVIKKEPTTSIAYNDRGVVLMDSNRVELAVYDFLNAIKYNPKYFEAYNNLGNAYGKLGRHKEEIESYTRAVTLAPTYHTAFFNRGLAYAKAGEFKEALQDYETVQKVEPSNSQLYYSKGIAFHGLGNDSMAIESYSKAISLLPTYESAYNNRGNIYFRHQQYEKAIEDYNYVLSMNPKSGSTYYNRSAAYFQKKEYKKAIEDAVQAQKNGYKVDPQYTAIVQTQLNHK